jgi:hypothetical protein
MNGFGFRPDDHGNTATAATTTKFVNDRFSVNGVIEKITDRDVFRFTTLWKMPFHLDAVPFSITSGANGSDLDMQVDILDSTEKVIGSYNPPSALGISIDTTLEPGTYYLRVQGRGNVYAPEYASLGSYALSATVTPRIPHAIYKLELTGTASNGTHNLNWVVGTYITIEGQELQVSDDGWNFHTLIHPAVNERDYHYNVSVLQKKFYRAAVLLDNGKTYYSNTLSLGTTIDVKPELNTHLIGSNLVVTAPAEWSYQISDYQGRILMKGRLRTGAQNLSTADLRAGMYVITFMNGRLAFSEKLVRP